MYDKTIFNLLGEDDGQAPVKTGTAFGSMVLLAVVAPGTPAGVVGAGTASAMLLSAEATANQSCSQSNGF